MTEGNAESHMQIYFIIDLIPECSILSNFETFSNLGVAEPYWLNSKGGAIWVEKEQPLFYSWNQNSSSKLCLASKKSLPYRMKVDDTLELSYTLCAGENAKEMQTYAAANFWGRPETIPDERMITSPIWSTWAQYKAEINESIVMEFANNIISYGFDNSQLEIDDKWEACYGDAKFDLTKFPDPARLVTNLKAKGFRVTLWIHPFVNLECESFGIATNPTSVYVVRDPKVTNYFPPFSKNQLDPKSLYYSEF